MAVRRERHRPWHRPFARGVPPIASDTPFPSGTPAGAGMARWSWTGAPSELEAADSPRHGRRRRLSRASRCGRAIASMRPPLGLARGGPSIGERSLRHCSLTCESHTGPRTGLPAEAGHLPTGLRTRPGRCPCFASAGPCVLAAPPATRCERGGAGAEVHLAFRAVACLSARIPGGPRHRCSPNLPRGGASSARLSQPECWRFSFAGSVQGPVYRQFAP